MESFADFKMTDLFDLAEEDLTDSLPKILRLRPSAGCILFCQRPQITTNSAFNLVKLCTLPIVFRPIQSTAMWLSSGRTALATNKNFFIARAHCETAQRNGFIFLVYDNALLHGKSGADGVLCSSV